MTTPPRPPLKAPLPRYTQEAVCPFCQAVFMRPRRGRPKIYCSVECRKAAWYFDRLGALLEVIQERETTPVAGRSQIRSDLWSMANRICVNRGVKGGNGYFRARPERQGWDPEEG